MNAHRVDAVARLLAGRRHSRRAALTTGALATAGLAGNAVSAAQDATPAGTVAGEKPGMLFVQSFRSGVIAAKEGGEQGTYTLTLEQGLGQTIYFSDRPERIVGADPTAGFLKGIGFSPDNPPNAALVVEPAPGETEIAVLEMYNPSYDEATHTATYDVKTLAAWERTLALGFAETPNDPAALAPTFGAAHLFIDDCRDADIVCYDKDGFESGSFDGQGMCYNYLTCFPCEPYFHTQPDKCATYNYWNRKCNDTFPDCGGTCWNDDTAYDYRSACPYR
jgi:hypothetical protein